MAKKEVIGPNVLYVQSPSPQVLEFVRGLRERQRIRKEELIKILKDEEIFENKKI